jgi:hypothetical protein
MAPLWALTDSAAAPTSAKPAKNVFVKKARRFGLLENCDVFKSISSTRDIINYSNPESE